MQAVAVVGPGLAGSLLALALARRNVPCLLLGPSEPSATGLSYGAMQGRAAEAGWRRLERRHGPLGWRRSRLLLHGWPAPLCRLPLALQALPTAALRVSRVDAAALAARLPAALAAAGVRHRAARVETITPLGRGWQLQLQGEASQEAGQVVLAAGAASRSLWPALPPQLRFSWAGVIVVEAGTAAGLDASGRLSAWAEQARRGGIVQPLRWQRPALEARAAELRQEAWIVDAGLAPFGERLLLGQISLVEPHQDPGQPPDPAVMEMRLRDGLSRLAPELAELPGCYRQVAVPFCTDGRPLAGAVSDAPGLWAFSGFSGAFSLVPACAERLAAELAAAGR